MTPPRTSENTDPNNRRRPGGKHNRASRQQRQPLQDANRGTPEGDDRLRQLEAENAQLRAQLSTRADSSSTRHGPRIAQPRNASAVKVSEIHEFLGMPRARWNALRTNIRFALSSACVDRSVDWRAQDMSRIERARNVTETDFPEMKRFVAGWGFKCLAQETFSGGKSYRKCVDDPNTYRGRKAAERRAAPARRRRQCSPPSHVSPVRPASPGPSGTNDDPPTPTPSPPPTRPSGNRARPPSDSDDEQEDDGLMDFDDDVSPSKGEGKKRARDDEDEPEPEEEEVMRWDDRYKRRRTD